MRGAIELRQDNHPHTRRAEIALSVERTAQNKGVATALMNRMLNVAANRGVQTIDLICSAENSGMLAIARKFPADMNVDNGEVEITIKPKPSNSVTQMLEAYDDTFSFAALTMNAITFNWANLTAPKLPANN